MRYSDLHLDKFPWTRILFVLAALCGTSSTQRLFASRKEYVYSYEAVSSSGVLLPATAASAWGLCGELVVQAEEESVIMQLRSLKHSMWNGPLDEQGEYVDVSGDAEELFKPFRVTYKLGLTEKISVKAEPVWATNIKRSIAGILQLDLLGLQNEVAFSSDEVNHYGPCRMQYVVTPEAGDEKLVRKAVDPRLCQGHPNRAWSNVPRMQCSNNDQDPVLKSSERLYRIKSDSEGEMISFVNATGGIYVQPFQSLGEAQFLFTRQTLQLISTGSTENKISTDELHEVSLQHELPKDDLTQGRSIPNKETVFKSIGILLDRLSQRLENPGLDIKVDNLHNTTTSVLLYYLGKLERADLQTAYNKISGTSYKEETIRNMFLEVLPQVGSKDAALFVLDLILQKKVSDITAIQLLTHLPFHVRRPDVQLLVGLQVLLNLPEGISPEVRHTAILSYGTLIYKTCSLQCSYEMLDDYVRLYVDKFTENKQYEEKMVWLEGLANIQLGKVVEFLELIASGDNTESRHLRSLAAWASLPSATMRSDAISRIYWPIFANRTEHLEMRIAALTLLMASDASPSRFISLYWYMQGEPDQHLYRFFYTSLKSTERTLFPCYAKMAGMAAQFTRVMRKPSSSILGVTGNYLLDYQDTFRHFGSMVQAVIIANPKTNIPAVSYLTLTNYGAGMNLNHVSLYIKAEGVLETLAPHGASSRILDILKEFKVKQKQEEPVHVEIIAQIQGKAVVCLHLNHTTIAKGEQYVKYLLENFYHVYQNTEFHVNQQRINVPLTMESIQVTDLGTNARLSVTAASLFSMRGNFTHSPGRRNNHVILRSSIHGSDSIQSYNPLTDLWHGAERAQSIHAYLPINVTIGLEETLFISYITPAEYIRTGITAHVRTATNIRGANSKSKLSSICPNCATLYTVKKYPQSTSKEFPVLELKTPELGGQLNMKVFDCESGITQDKLVNEVLASHRSNYQIWPAVRSGLLGIHLLDYFTYVPPRGSCGLAAHFEPHNLESTEVKLDFIKNGKYSVISLIRRPLGSSDTLQQWNVGISYETSGWTTDKLKIKATRNGPGDQIMKICAEVEREIPWNWDFLSNMPSDPSSVKLNIVWGPSDSAKGKCSGATFLMNLAGEVSDEQIQESKAEEWPYRDCRQQSLGKQFTPYTKACYEASKELSTLRKYQIFVKYENLPESLTKSAWKLRALYDLMGGNSSDVTNTDQFIVGAVFPKESSKVEVQLNRDKAPIEINPDIVDFLLTRTRLHAVAENPLLQKFFSTCVITPTTARSVYNVSVPLTKNRETLALGHCYSDHPGFAVTAKSESSGVAISLYEGGDKIRIVPQGSGAVIYNHSLQLPLEANFEFRDLNLKKIRLGERTVELAFADIILFVHWTQEQVLLFYPNYVRGFSCGLCANQDPDNVELYENYL